MSWLYKLHFSALNNFLLVPFINVKIETVCYFDKSVSDITPTIVFCVVVFSLKVTYLVLMCTAAELF